MARRKLKIIDVIDPKMCMGCDLAYIADCVMKDGRRKKMFYCRRGDCDNWRSFHGRQVEVEMEVDSD